MNSSFHHTIAPSMRNRSVFAAASVKVIAPIQRWAALLSEILACPGGVRLESRPADLPE